MSGQFWKLHTEPVLKQPTFSRLASIKCPLEGVKVEVSLKKVIFFAKFPNFAHFWRTGKNSYSEKSGEFLKRLGVLTPELLNFFRFDLIFFENFQFENK